ncbi:MAG: hypothetical protein ACI4B3_01660 [Prevotella sp.]
MSVEPFDALHAKEADYHIKLIKTDAQGSACTVNFEPVKTTAVKMEIDLPADNSAGLFEWSVK